MVLTSSKTVDMLLGGSLGCIGLGVCLQKSSQRQWSTRMCVFLHKSSCPQFSTKQKISISYFWRPEYINPKMTEKSARVLSDEGRVNWWSRHQVSTCWSTPAVIYDSRRRIRCILGHLCKCVSGGVHMNQFVLFTSRNICFALLNGILTGSYLNCMN